VKAVIAAYARSPFHLAKKGALAGVRPDTPAAQVVTGLFRRNPIDPTLLEDVIVDCACPEASQGNNLARRRAAGRPAAGSWGTTVNRFCIRELGLDPAIVNLDGGGMDIGHPLGRPPRDWWERQPRSSAVKEAATPWRRSASEAARASRRFWKPPEFAKDQREVPVRLR